MAAFLYTNAMLQMLTSGSPSPLPLQGGYASNNASTHPNFQIMLVQTSQAAYQADTAVSTHLTTGELTATAGYTKGWVSVPTTAGRQLCNAAATIASNIVNIKLNAGTAFVWTGVTGVNNIVGAALILQGSADDTTGIPIAYWDLSSPITPNGSNFTLTVSSTANITFTT